jgi:hypothetical protein
MKRVNNRIKCDFCKKRNAKYNYQKVWTRFLLTKDEDYTDGRILDELDITDNLHLCEKCAMEFEGVDTIEDLENS